MSIRYLDPFEVLIIHVLLVDWSKEERSSINNNYANYIRSELLDSAVQNCKQPYYSTIYLKAAALFRSLTMNHAFPDGNKRTATISLIVFLLLNGYDLHASDEELVKFALKVAKGYLRNIYVIKAWIKKRMVKINDSDIRSSRIKLYEAFKDVLRMFKNDSQL